MTLYAANLTFTVSADSLYDAIGDAQRISDEIAKLLGIDNWVSEVFRQ